jgi:hypothetical protein
MALPAAEREQMGLAGRAYCGREFGREELIDRLEQWIEELQPPVR